jgi:hypothetical protein
VERFGCNAPAAKQLTKIKPLVFMLFLLLRFPSVDCKVARMRRKTKLKGYELEAENGDRMDRIAAGHRAAPASIMLR